eukprot:TRINITY_DN6415_c0_g1_i1.p1 TRINITY_DN6415_c0_g1~~TRINITY_DN6415_c0_g1_i1.p1  ORF type:complete len:64 (+),score=4.62 TRINITY_DN6415_c0_g1_i1:114-305(+)
MKGSVANALHRIVGVGGGCNIWAHHSIKLSPNFQHFLHQKQLKRFSTQVQNNLSLVATVGSKM